MMTLAFLEKQILKAEKITEFFIKLQDNDQDFLLN